MNPRAGYGSSMIGPGRWSRYPRLGADDAASAAASAAAPAGSVSALCHAMESQGCTINQPDWAKCNIGPGVQLPQEQLFPLPLASTTGVNVFTAGGPTVITLTARPQKPFRGERPVSMVTRIAAATGSTVAGVVPVIRGGIRVGTAPQVASANDMPLEFLDRSSFGVRQMLMAAEPGIDINVDIALVGPALATGDSITVFLTIFGSVFG